jgi:hypothetical protein
MTELTFNVGPRVTLDLRDSAGTIALKDWDEATMRVTTEGTSPLVLREGDSFRIKLDRDATITLPAGLPVEVLTPATVQLRLMRVTRGGGETVVRPVAAGAAGEAAGSPAAGAASGESTGSAAPETATPDPAEFARTMSETGRRIFAEMTRALRAGSTGMPEEVAKRMEEAAERIDEQARRTAERVQREVERTYEAAGRVRGHAQRAATRAEEQARRVADRVQERAARGARRRQHGRWWTDDPEELARIGMRVGRAAARAGRGRWWFTEGLDDARDRPANGGGVPRQAPATSEERLAILKMLQDGKITAEQAAKLLEALGS